jgi:hypothetical protein
MADTLALDPPAIFAPSGRVIQTMPFALWKAVETCDQELRRHGMQMIIICEACLAKGDPHPIVDGDNKRGGSSFTMTCTHAERRLDLTT